MNYAINDYIRRTADMDWLPLSEPGIDTRGIFFKPLRKEPDSGRPVSFILRFDPGASYPYHSHPEGEEILVLAGSCHIEGATLKEGDYLYTPAGFRHGVTSEGGCVLFLMVPAEVEIINPNQV